MRNQSRFTRVVHATELLEPRRLLASIGLDRSFGHRGTALAPVDADGIISQAHAIAEVADQKILVVGGGINITQPGPIALARFNANGTLDTTYSGDGVATPFVVDSVDGAAIQPDGRVVVIGTRGRSAGGAPNGQLFVARVNADGTPDTTFSGDGIVDVDAAAGARFKPTDVAVGPNGEVVAVGYLFDELRYVLARLTPDGALDAGFGGGDGLLPQADVATGKFFEVAVQPDGRIVLAGEASDFIVVARFTATGAPDNSFDGDGRVQLFGSGGIVLDAALQADGKILLALDERVARLNPVGSLDFSFSGDGFADPPASIQQPASADDLFVDAQGRIVGVAADAGVFRYLTDGAPDTTFGADGGIPLTFGFVGAPATDGDVIVGGVRGTAALIAARVGERPDVAIGPTGVIAVTGTDDADTVTLDLFVGRARLTRNGVGTQFVRATVTGLDAELLGGDDSLATLLHVDTRVGTGAGGGSVTTGNGNDQVLADAADGDLVVSTGAGLDSVATGTGDDSITTGDGKDTVRAGAGDDSITTGGGDDVIATGLGANAVVSNAGNDSIIGGDGADSIDAGAGDDRVLASFGDNTLAGGAGNDLLEGLDGNDSITGGDGDDRLLGGNGNNAVFGGTGNDYLRTGSGADTLWGEIGNDEMRAGAGDDYLNGGASKDRMLGQQGNDILYGGRSNDRLEGGPGSDLLKGLDDNDKLFARDGTPDTLDGGAGTDTSVSDEEPLDTVLRIETEL